MTRYAHLNENNICTTIVIYSTPLIAVSENMIMLNDSENVLNKKYDFEMGIWSGDLFDISTGKRFKDLNEKIAILEVENEMLKLMVAELGLIVGGTL